MPDGAGGGIDVRAAGGSSAVAAELDAIFAAFTEREFQRDVHQRSEAHGRDAPASALPRTDAQRRFDALVEIFRRATTTEGDQPSDSVIDPVVNLVVDLYTLEQILARHNVTPLPEFERPRLDHQRLEYSDGTTAPPDAVLRAALHGRVRTVVIDPAGVPLNAGRTRRLFTGAARDLALLLATQCDHLGCTVPASRCDVDHMAGWDRDHGATDIDNARPRCTTHNRWKSQHGLTSTRHHNGRVVDRRDDGSAMFPVGRLIPSDDDDHPDDGRPDAA